MPSEESALKSDPQSEERRTREALPTFTDCHAGIVGHLDALGELDALLASAARARQIAQQAVEFFDEMILEHHEDEERELFPTVRKHAAAGDERALVDSLCDRLTADHRALEKQWNVIKPQLARIATGKDTRLDTEATAALIASYKAHAHFEETHLLPLAAEILGRSDAELARLGYALHIRHATRTAKPFG
tara:strand:+ start:519 stop:1091 length:573 start_codon:yes stop_codon:yes gene_type:complete